MRRFSLLDALPAAAHQELMRQLQQRAEAEGISPLSSEELQLMAVAYLWGLGDEE